MPHWLSVTTVAAMRAAWLSRAGQDRGVAEAAVREIALARHPALPLTLIEDAVALVIRR